jgi:hypothetical protein
MLLLYPSNIPIKISLTQIFKFSDTKKKLVYYFVDLLGFKDGLLPGVFLLSLLLLSRVPSFFLGFGPGLIASIFIICFILIIYNYLFLKYSNSYNELFFLITGTG